MNIVVKKVLSFSYVLFFFFNVGMKWNENKSKSIHLIAKFIVVKDILVKKGLQWIVFNLFWNDG